MMMEYLTTTMRLTWSLISLLLGFKAMSIAAGDATVASDIAPTLPNYGFPVAATTLINSVFANSWGKPAIVQYNPPTVTFDHVTLTVEFDTYGVQYDRLAHIFIDGVEIWRPSTPEPLYHNVTGTFTKDLSSLLPLFQRSGELVFQLDNIVDDNINGEITAKLSIDYYFTNRDVPDQYQDFEWFIDTPPSDVIPIQDESNALLSLPPDANLTIPQLSTNTTRAVIQVLASGNGNEEFWYAGSITSDSGPTRVVELSIGGNRAGIVNPFQQLYTGADRPQFWTPTVGIHAYDVPSYYIDVSPFLPLLWESSQSLDIVVSNIYSNETVKSNWLVNTALIVWEEEGEKGSGQFLGSSFSSHVEISEQQSDGQTGLQFVSLNYTFEANAALLFNSGELNVSWSQNGYQSSAQYGKDDDSILSSGLVGTDEIQRTSSSEDKEFTRSFKFPVVIASSDQEEAIKHSYVIDAKSPTHSWYENRTQFAQISGDVKTNTSVFWKDSDEQFTHIVLNNNNEIIQDTTFIGDINGASSSDNDILDNISQIIGLQLNQTFEQSAALAANWLHQLLASNSTSGESSHANNDLASGLPVRKPPRLSIPSSGIIYGV